KKNSVDKKEGDLLAEDIQLKYKAIIELCRFKMDHYKIKAARCVHYIMKYKAVIEKCEDKIDNIEAPEAGGVDPNPKVKEAMDKLQLDIRLNRIVIRDNQENIIINEELIKLYRGQALAYARRLRKHEKLFSAESGQKKEKSRRGFK
ncbi:MAG: hypothetical protein KAX15_02265, partial [Candidatus Omnitrophica bacterium]|nr:hypothetical protein [Candidatus Omnitrophota bacterium]